MQEKRISRGIRLGKLVIGGGAPVMVQSMTNTDTRDVEATLAQIDRLVRRGCEAVRVAVPDMTAAKALRALRDGSPVPLIADIHFDYRLALAALEAGLEGLRINPGNIGPREHVDRVVDAAKANGAVIRVGVNSGSVEKHLLQKYGGPCVEAMVESALSHVRMLEDRGFYDTKISLKSSSVLDTIAAYRLLVKSCDYPLHIGVTEAGGLMRGTVKSAVGLGILLHEGIGDTLRVSLTADPAEEVTVAWEILRALGLRGLYCFTRANAEKRDRYFGSEDSGSDEVEDALAESTADIKVAVMGCVVNGPGEAREADLGVAGGRDKGIIFRKGEVIRSVKGQDALLAAFMEELQRLLKEKETH